MTSLELVKFINEHRRAQAEAAGVEFPSKGYAELGHNDFMKKVTHVLGEGVGNFSHTYVNPQNGQTYPCYRFPKREACLMAMSYSYEIQAKVFDRMTELEARQAQQVQVPTATPFVLAIGEFQASMSFVEGLGLDKNAAIISANQTTTHRTGLNLLAMHGLTHLVAVDQEHLYFTPTQLGKRLDVSARQFNMLLSDAGLQVKKNDVWAPTESARGLYRLLDTGKRHGSGVPITQLKWSSAVLDHVTTEGL